MGTENIEGNFLIEGGTIDPLRDFDFKKGKLKCPATDYYEKASGIMSFVERETEGPGVACVPYEGTKSLLSGGKASILSLGDILEFIEFFSERGRSVMVPFNGGINVRKDIVLDLNGDKRFGIEREILGCLDHYSKKYGVEHSVTLLRDDIRDQIATLYPGLRKVASCIKFAGGKTGSFRGMREYEDAFETYDRVVIAPQHTDPQFLERFAENIHKAVLLVLTGCSREDLSHCYDHYLEQERAIQIQTWLNWEKDELEQVESREDFACIPKCTEFEDYCPFSKEKDEKKPRTLIEAPHTVRKLIETGVRNFKSDRSFGPVGFMISKTALRLLMQQR